METAESTVVTGNGGNAVYTLTEKDIAVKASVRDWRLPPCCFCAENGNNLPPPAPRVLIPVSAGGFSFSAAISY